jgi:hypothetical protein
MNRDFEFFKIAGRGKKFGDLHLSAAHQLSD